MTLFHLQLNQLENEISLTIKAKQLPLQKMVIVVMLLDKQIRFEQQNIVSF